jgi:hypothetical protein
VGKQPWRQPDWRLPLVSHLAFPNRLPIENAVFQIDPATSYRRLIKHRTADRASTRPRIQADEEKPRDVMPDGAVGLLSELELSHPTSRAQKMSGLPQRQPPFPRRTALRQNNGREGNAQPRLPVMPYCSPQIF